MKSTQNTAFYRVTLFFILGIIFLYSSLGIASIFFPDVGTIIYALISCFSLFFTIIFLIIKHILTPRRFSLEILLYISSYVAISCLAYRQYIISLTDAEIFIAVLGNCATVLGFTTVFLDFALEMLSELGYSVYFRKS